MPSGGRLNPLFISTFGPNSLGTEVANIASAAPASDTWPATDRSILVPFVVESPYVAMKLWFVVGGTASGNYKMAVYREDFVRLAVTTAAAATAANSVEEQDITDLILQPGRYYLGLTNSGTTGTVSRAEPSVEILKALGVCASTTSLPDPASPVVVATNDYIPLMGLAGRTLVE
jgi:hypothetical protein